MAFYSEGRLRVDHRFCRVGLRTTVVLRFGRSTMRAAFVPLPLLILPCQRIIPVSAVDTSVDHSLTIFAPH